MILFALLGLGTTARAQEVGYTMEGFLLGPDGDELEIEPIYRRHFTLREPNYLRTLAWQVALLTGGTAWYWIEADTNARDWDYPNFLDRLTLDAIRFDNNSFTINHLSHPVSGGFYYLTARGNELGVAGASLTSFLSSAVWEFGLEFREKVSINDQIHTPGAGIAMGEVFYRLGHYLNSAPGGGGWAHQTFAWLLGWPVAIHRWLDDVPPVNDGLKDSLGFSAAYHHRFRLAWRGGYEEDAFHDTGMLQGFQTEIDLVAIPGFQKPGKFTLLFDDGNFTRFDGAFAWKQNGDAAHVDLWFESALYGQYQQDYTGFEDAITGMASRLSITFAFEHVQRWEPSPRDRRAVLHLPGANAAAWGAYKGLVGRVELALHPDFVSMDSLAFPLWKGNHKETLAQSVVEDHGYYFGLGGTTWIAASLAYQGLELDGRIRFGHVNSIEGIDRAQEKIQNEVEMEDDLLEYRARLGYSHPTWLASARLEYQFIERRGSAGLAEGLRSWNRYTLTTGIQF
jgi:RES domain-containing protein